MTETVSLKKAETFLRIVDGGETFYGGDQAWFDFAAGRESACGTVAAADITAYLAAGQPELRRLYARPGSMEVLEREHFLAHMVELYGWVKPWEMFGRGFGIWPPGRFARGVVRFARSRGIFLADRRMGSHRPLGQLTEFIGESLGRDCPVAMLIGWNPGYEREPVKRPDGSGWLQEHFSMHWVVITEVTERAGTPMVKVSTWGGYAWLDLEAWHRAGSLIAGLVSFQWMSEVRGWNRVEERQEMAAGNPGGIYPGGTDCSAGDFGGYGGGYDTRHDRLD